MWYYKLPKFELSITAVNSNKFLLKINDFECDTYADPKIAADNVFTQTTGYLPFDSCQEDATILAIPPDLSEWTRC